MASEDSLITRAAESSFGYDTLYPYGTGSEFYGDYWYGGPFTAPPPYLDQQKRGEALPFYLNEWQLKVIRDRSRKVCGENEFALAVLENRKSYIVGSGFKYRALSRHAEDDTELADEVQRFIDYFIEVNDLPSIERESVERDDRDGESFIRLFPQDDGMTLLRWVEPEHVRSPSGESFDNRLSFGVETEAGDIQNIKAYWVVADPIANTNPVRVLADKIVHHKCNVDSASKRGMPLLYSVESNLRRAEEILAAMSSTAKARAKIALIRKVDGSSKSAAQRMKAGLETGESVDPMTGGVTNVEQLQLGTVLTSSKNLEYEYPRAGDGSMDIVGVLQAELRAVCARCVMPEAMVTANVSGGTYSSQLVAEAPATRNFERLQQVYRAHFGERKKPRSESLLWRAIKHAVAVKVLPEEALSRIRIVADAPAVIARDPDKAAAAYQTYYNLGATSAQRIAAELGYDFAQIQRERQDAEAMDPQQQDLMMGGAAPEGGEAPQEGPAGEFDFDGQDFSDL